MGNQTLEVLHGILYGKGIRFGQLSPLGGMLATITGTHGDVVPFIAPQIHDHAMTVARVPASKYYWNADLLVRTQIAVERWYGFGLFTVIPDSYNFEVEALGAKMIYSDAAMPTVDLNEPLIKSPADLDRVGPLDPTKGRIPNAIEMGKLVPKLAPGPLSGGYFCSPWSLICLAVTYPKAIRALMRDKAYGRALFDWAENRVLWPYLQALAKAGVKNAIGADAWSAFPDMSPELLEEWVMPYAKRFNDRAKKELGMTTSAGFLAGDYCEEDPAKFDKELMFKALAICHRSFALDVTPIVMGRTQDWDMRWVQEFAVLNGKGGRKLPIFASLNGRFMRDAPLERIVDKIREWIDIMGRDGGLMFFIGNVPADTPPLNMHTAVQAVKILGRYPIAPDLASIPVAPARVQPFDIWLKGQPEADLIFKAREK
jgi:uroporphyrinogen-III decarboxylase